MNTDTTFPARPLKLCKFEIEFYSELNIVLPLEKLFDFF